MWEWSGLSNPSMISQVCIHIKSHKSSSLWCWKYSNKIMDVFGFSVLRFAVANRCKSYTLKKQGGARKNNAYSFGHQATDSIEAIKTFLFFFHITTCINTHICKQWRHLGRLFFPSGFFPCLSYEPIWNGTKVDRRAPTVFSEYWVKPRITCTNTISLNSSQNGSTEIPSSRLL